MYYNKNDLNKHVIFSRNKNFARPFTVHSYVSSYWGDINNHATPHSTENATTIKCNDELEKDSTQIDNLNSIATTTKVKTGLTLNTFLISIIVLMTILILVLIVLVLKSPNTNTCLTPTCIESASRVLQRLDNDIDPCVDFYSFACGKFLKNAVLPDKEVTLTSFSEISIELTNQLKNLINLPVTNGSSRVQRALQQIYKYCMKYEDMSHNETLNVKLLLESLGGWPMVMGNKWNQNDFDFKNLTIRLKQIGIPYSHPFFFTVSQDLFKADTYRIFALCDPPTVIPSDNVKVILRLALDLGGNESIIINDYKNYAEFINYLHQVCPGDRSGRKTTFRDVLKRTGYNWAPFVQELIGTTSITITDTEEIFVGRNFERCFQFFLKTPKRFQANLVFIEIFVKILSYLPGLQSNYGIKPNSEMCVTTVSKSLPLMINSLYVKTYFDNQSRVLIKELIINIQKEFMGILKTVDWFDERTRKAAIEKLSAMKICIGYPDELLNNTKLENFYSNLKLNLTTYLNMMMSINAFNADKKYKLLREPVKNCYWIDKSEKVTVVNAYYNTATNGIIVPAGILYKTVFDVNRPNFLNYGTIGVIIGHEITHGFDNTGKNYDKDGNFANWWSNETSATFQKKAQCIVEQYGKYVVPQINMSIDGLLTLGENIADNGGLKHSFLAYKNWVKRQGVEKMLPGLNYTYDQMFWIAFAQFWCSYNKLNYLRQIMADEHAPEMFRVIGTLSNSEKFSEDFKCSVGSPMNPKNKCNVW